MRLKPVYLLAVDRLRKSWLEHRNSFIKLGLIRGQRDYARFVILCTGRVGSNMLSSFLNSHPGIVVKGEIFGQSEARGLRNNANLDLDAYIEREAYSDYPRGIQAAGFKLFYNHAKRKMPEPNAMWNYLEADRSIKMIHLTRDNLLRAYLSKVIADKTARWTQAGPLNAVSTEEKRTTLDFDEAKRRFSKIQSWESEANKSFRNHDMIHVTYEQLAAEPQPTLNDIQKFLGVEPRNLSSFHTKQNPERLSVLIENYSELKAKFADTSWIKYFDD